MGTDTPSSGQRGLGISGTAAETVRERKSPSGNVQRDTEMGEYVGDVGGQSNSDGHSSAVSGLTDNDGATYSTKHNEEQTAEVDTPAVSFTSELLTALKEHRTVYIEDEPEQMIADARKNSFTNRRIEYDNDEKKYIMYADSNRYGQIIKGAWLYGTESAEEIADYLVQNGYKISRYENISESNTIELPN